MISGGFIFKALKKIAKPAIGAGLGFLTGGPPGAIAGGVSGLTSAFTGSGGGFDLASLASGIVGPLMMGADKNGGDKKGETLKSILNSPLLATGLGGILAGIGGAKKAGIEAQAAKEIAQMQLFPHIRGGTSAAGNMELFSSGQGLNPQDYEMLARAMSPTLAQSEKFRKMNLSNSIMAQGRGQGPLGLTNREQLLRLSRI